MSSCRMYCCKKRPRNGEGSYTAVLGRLYGLGLTLHGSTSYPLEDSGGPHTTPMTTTSPSKNKGNLCGCSPQIGGPFGVVSL